MGASSPVGLWETAVRLLQLQDGPQQQPGSSGPGTSSSGPSHEDIWDGMELLMPKLEALPPQPKAVWKKLVQQLKVPLSVGTAFSRAAQHSWQSARAAASALNLLLRAAMAAGIIREGPAAASNSLAASIHQQLQQAGVLPQLAAVAASIAAALQAEATALASEVAAGLCAEGLSERTQASLHFCVDAATLLGTLPVLWGSSQGRTPAVANTAWVHEPRLAEAGLQLSMAAQQYVSAAQQHLLPALQQRDPTAAGVLAEKLQSACILAASLGERVLLGLSNAVRSTDSSTADARLKQLLLSPHTLPCVAALFLRGAVHLARAAALGGSGQQETRSRAGNRPGEAAKEVARQAVACAMWKPPAKNQAAPPTAHPGPAAIADGALGEQQPSSNGSSSSSSNSKKGGCRGSAGRASASDSQHSVPAALRAGPGVLPCNSSSDVATSATLGRVPSAVQAQPVRGDSAPAAQLSLTQPQVVEASKQQQQRATGVQLLVCAQERVDSLAEPNLMGESSCNSASNQQHVGVSTQAPDALACTAAELGWLQSTYGAGRALAAQAGSSPSEQSLAVLDFRQQLLHHGSLQLRPDQHQALVAYAERMERKTADLAVQAVAAHAVATTATQAAHTAAEAAVSSLAAADRQAADIAAEAAAAALQVASEALYASMYTDAVLGVARAVLAAAQAGANDPDTPLHLPLSRACSPENGMAGSPGCCWLPAEQCGIASSSGTGGSSAAGSSVVGGASSFGGSSNGAATDAGLDWERVWLGPLIDEFGHHRDSTAAAAAPEPEGLFSLAVPPCPCFTTTNTTTTAMWPASSDPWRAQPPTS